MVSCLGNFLTNAWKSLDKLRFQSIRMHIWIERCIFEGKEKKTLTKRVGSSREERWHEVTKHHGSMNGWVHMKNNDMNLRSTKTIRIEMLVGPAWYKSYLVSPEKEKREKEHHDIVPERRKETRKKKGSKLQKTTIIRDPNSENHHHSFFFQKTTTIVLTVFKKRWSID